MAVKIDGKVKYLIEVKAAAISLNSAHMQQALNYAANHGIEWVVLTNALDWKLYRIKFAKPIDFEDVSSFNLLNLNIKSEDDLNKMFLLCREGMSSDAIGLYHQHTQLVNKFMIAQLAISETVVSAIRRELKKLFPELKVELEQITDILINDVLKREVIEGDKVKETQLKIKKTSAKLARLAIKKVTDPVTE